MKNFVLYSSKETPHPISEDSFEEYTKSVFPFKQKIDGANKYYATCPECENPIQLKGLYNDSSQRVYGAHTGKDIKGLNPYIHENYIYCPRSVQGTTVPKDQRKEIVREKDIAIYNTIRENFDLVVSYAKTHLGYYISEKNAKECLRTYYASQGWLYPHSTVNNIPFMIFYLQCGTNPYGLWIRKESELEQSIIKCKDLQLETINDKAGKYYNRLVPASHEYMVLTMMLHLHKCKEDNDGTLRESINIQISKDISKDTARHNWKDLVETKIDIPELEFVNFINSQKKYRNENLIQFAKELMPPIIF